MKLELRLFGAVLLAVIVSGSGCSKGNETSNAESPSPVASDVSPLPSEAASPLSASPAASAASPASSAGGAASAGTYTDTSGVNGEKEITTLAQLGVVDPPSGTFDPGGPIKRREFVRWLVKANNALWSDTPTKLLKLADSTEKSSFPDITTSDPDFPYIQGMQDAGYSEGFPDKTFRPDQILTREQMFAIKNVFDRGSVDPGLVKDLTFARTTVMPPWKDKPSISKTYVAAIATGAGGGGDSFGRVYGASSLFRPQEPVTRAQAAVMVSVIGDHVFAGGTQRTAAQKAAVSPSP
jgi:S-layer homology domain